MRFFLSIAVIGLFFLFHFLGWNGWFILCLIALNLTNYLGPEFSEKELSKAYRDLHRSKLVLISMVLALAALFVAFPWVLTLIGEKEMGWPFAFAFLSTAIMYSTFSVSIGHELVHHRSKILRWVGHAVLSIMGLPGFSASHIFGHHSFIGTENDPSVARHGEHFYRFFFRIFPFRLKQIFSPYFPKRNVQRKMKQSNLTGLIIWMSFIVGLGVFLDFGLGWTSYLGLCMVNYLFFETTNYVQHYGLIQNGSTQLGIDNAWNNYMRYTNYLTYLLPIHSSHHLKSAHEIGKKGPTLPYSYFIMIVLALVPILWFRLMNPRVESVIRLSHD